MVEKAADNTKVPSHGAGAPAVPGVTVEGEVSPGELVPGNAEQVRRAHARLAAAMKGRHVGDRPEETLDTARAMPMVLRLEKTALPLRADVLEAAARAAVAVCLCADAAIDGSGAATQLDHWYGLKIRKVARRASGAAWRRAGTVPGVTVTTDSGAQARATLPGLVSEVAPEIRKLQIHGTDLPADPKVSPESSPARSAAPLGAGPEEHAPQVSILVDQSLQMTVGKAAAQVGHASMLLAAAMDVEWVVRWAADGFPLRVVEVAHDVFQRAMSAPGAVVVADAGYTEVAPGARTVVALPQAVEF